MSEAERPRATQQLRAVTWTGGLQLPKSEPWSGVDNFLARVAARERSQGRLSIAALTAAACAAQLEAQCREVLAHRSDAPGPDDVDRLITGLQHTREELMAFMQRAFDMETATVYTLQQPAIGLEARLRKQLAHERLLVEFVTASMDAATHIARLARFARRVRKLRREVRGGSPPEDALLGAASVAVLDVIQRAVRMSRVRDPALRAACVRAEARLRSLTVVPAVGQSDTEPHEAPLVLDKARLN